MTLKTADINMNLSCDVYLSQIVCGNYSPTEVYETIGVFTSYEEAYEMAEKKLSDEYHLVSMVEVYIEKIKFYLGNG